MIAKKTSLLINSVSCFILLIISIFFSCKKFDFSQNKETPDHINYARKFFDVPPGSPQYIIKMVAKMKKLNDSTGFIKDFIKKNGCPAWNKYILPNKDYNLTNKENSFTAGDSLFIIPIIEENSNFVSSFIFGGAYNKTISG